MRLTVTFEGASTSNLIRSLSPSRDIERVSRTRECSMVPMGDAEAVVSLVSASPMTSNFPWRNFTMHLWKKNNNNKNNVFLEPDQKQTIASGPMDTYL